MKARLVEYLIGILGTAFIAAGLLLYIFSEPGRIDTAQAAQLAADLDEAMTLYAENCAVCHGLSGEGLGSIPALNAPGVQSMDTDTLGKIISRGLFETAMPAWDKADGGPLSAYQISELVSLIQFGDWDAVQDRVVNLGLAPQVPFSSEPDPEILAALQAGDAGGLLAQGILVYAQQCVACHGPDGLGTTLAPALNDPAVRAKDPAELERIIMQGAPGTLMAGWEGALPAEDLAALLALLTDWEQVPQGAIPAPERPVPVTAESLALGETLYAANCSTCHGPDGQGTQRAPSLNVKGFLADTNDLAIQQIVTLGVPGTHMPAWGDRLDAAEIQAIVGFMRAWEPDAPEVAEPARGGGPWWQSQTQPGGSGAQGPAWGRNSELQASGGQLPSGGQGKGRGGSEGGGAGRPDWAGQGQSQGGAAQGQAAPAGQQVDAAGVAPGTPGTPTLTPETQLAAGGGQGAHNNAGQSAAAPEHLPGTANPQGWPTLWVGPPWAQMEAPSVWWQGLDARMIALLGGLALLSGALVALGLLGVRRANALGS